MSAKLTTPTGMQIDKASFEEAARPLMKWLALHMHPHATVIVENNSAQLVEGVVCYRTDEFIPD